MTDELAVKKAIFNIGGVKLAGKFLGVSASTIGKWSRNGVIPNLEKAKLVAQESGLSLASLRPRFEQTAI
jgi:transcriptional regulator with XRE-family HTH domain